MTEALWWIPVVLVSLALFLLMGAGALRIAAPHTRKMMQEQDRLNKKAGTPAVAGSRATPAAGSAEAAGPGPAPNYHWVGNVALAGALIAIFYWRVYEPVSWGNPGFAAVNAWVWTNWLLVLLVASIIAAMVAYNAPWARKHALSVLLRILVFLFFVTGLMDWSYRNIINPTTSTSAAKGVTPPVRSQASCTRENPCTPAMSSDGQTMPLPVRSGTSICFDAAFWQYKAKLGYTTSFGGIEMSPGCTSAGCYMDTFWFKPEGQVPLPKYWFVPQGSTQC